MATVNQSSRSNARRVWFGQEATMFLFQQNSARLASASSSRSARSMWLIESGTFAFNDDPQM